MGQCFLYGNSGAGVGTAGGINFSVKNYATVDTLLTATPQENTIGIVSSTAISNYYFCVGQPGLAYEDVDMMSNVTLANGYISATGTISSQTAANPELYTETYIPVNYGDTYQYTYTVSASKSMYLSITEYTGNYTFKQRLVPVSSVTGTSQVGTYTPSAATITAVRLSWRTFPSTTYTMAFVHKNDGAVWIKTMSDSVVSFNAIKKNMLEVYPTAASQYVSGAWETCVAYIYQNGAWKQFWNGELFENGNLYSDHTGGWPVTMGVQRSTDPYLYYNAGAQNLIFGTAKKIDVTNFSSLHVIGRGRGDYAYQGGVSARTPSFGIASALSSSGSGGVTYAARADLSVGYVGISTLPSFTTESVLDLTSYSGEYYIAFSVTGSHTNAEIAIKKVWLE